jgi:hypothetical protein
VAVWGRHPSGMLARYLATLARADGRDTGRMAGIPAGKAVRRHAERLAGSWRQAGTR